jgi:hypothetical protein
MPKQVFIESRNQTLEFPDDATQEEINQVIAAEFPRTGEDVAYDMSKMGSVADIRDFIAAIPDEDYVKLNNYRADKKLSWGELAGISGEAIGTIVGDVVKGVKSAFTEAGEGVLESAARGVGAGTVDLVNLGQKLITPNERIPSIDEFLQTPKTHFGYAYGPGGPSVSQVAATPEDYKTLIYQQRAMELQSLDLAEVSESLIKGAPVEEVARGASYLDAITLGGLAKNIAKSGLKTVFKKTAQAPVSTAVGATIETGESVIPAAMRQNAEAFAAKVGEGAKKAGLTGVQLGAGTVKGAADLGKAVIDTAGKLGLSEVGVRGGVGALIGYQEGGAEGAMIGAVAGTVIPKIARAGLAGVSRTADFVGAAAKVAKQGPRRTGLFENMAQATNISPEARRVAEKVLFTQPFFEYASEAVRQAAQRALIGAPIGAAIGYATDGEEGAAAGFGAGVGISALGGPLDATIDAAKRIAGRSTARSQRNAMGDIKSFVNDITDDKARSDYAEVMDRAIRVAGPERAADMLDNLRLAEAMGASVQVVPPSQRKNVFNSFSYDGTNGGTITINPDRMTQGTVSHEVFHQLFNVGVKAELQKALRETYLPTRDADGNIIKPGLYDDAEFAKKAAQLAERYKNNPEGYRVALEAQSVLENPAGYSEAALDNARSFVIDEMTAEYSEAFMGRSRPGVFNPDRLPLWHRRLLQQIDDRILNTINDKLYANRNIKDPTVAFTDEQGKPIRVPQLDKVLRRAFANKMGREKGQVAGKTQKVQEVVIPNKPRDLLVFANATFGATRDVLGTDENGNPRILTPQEQKAVTAADFDEARAMYQTLPDTEKQTVRVTNKVGEAVDINQSGARIQITSQTPESVFEKFLAVAKSRGMGNQQLANMRQLFASMVANEGPTFNTVNNPVYEFDKRTGTMKAKVRPPTRQEIYPTAITVNSAGGFNVEYIDISRVKANAQKILQNPQYKGVWMDVNDFMADFGRSMRNLSTPNPIPTAELLGNGNIKIGATKRDLIAEAMNVTLPKRLADKGYVNEPTIDPLTLLTSQGKERRVGGSAFRDFRIERLTEVSPTTERLKMVKENAYENLVRRFQPDAFAKETLPNGETLTNPDGYRILKKAGSKLLRVYDRDGKLLGVESSEAKAMSKAQSDFAKKTTKEEKQTRFQPGEWSQKGLENHPLKPLLGGAFTFNANKINEKYIKQANESAERLGGGTAFNPSRKSGEDGQAKLQLDGIRSSELRTEDEINLRLTQDSPNGKLKAGGEHFTFIPDNKDYVIKSTQVTPGGNSGFIVDESVGKDFRTPQFRFLGFRNASISEYVARTAEFSKIFNIPWQVVEIAQDKNGHPVIYSLMKKIEGTPLKDSSLDDRKAVNKLLMSKGFEYLGDSYLTFKKGYERLEGISFFNPKTGVLISDAEPRNFVRTKSGKIEPVDLMINKFPLEYNIRFQPVTPEQDAAYLNAVKTGDNAAAQRMVDEAARGAGFTIGPVWHGGAPGFNVFDWSKIGQQGTSEGKGFYFTNDKSIAEGYARDHGGRLLQVYLKAGKPLSGQKITIKKDSLKKILLDVHNKSESIENWSSPLWDYGDIGYEPLSKVINDTAQNLLDFSESDVSLAGGLINSGADAQILYDAIYKQTGKTGIVESDAWGKKGHQVHVATSPSHIKVADPITYDDNGNVIPLSQRFNPESLDIRFQPDSASPNIQVGTNGTRIIKSPSGKFRVYSVTGTLLGIRDTEQAAKKLATK